MTGAQVVTPRIAMYAEHMYHCMWILLYGKLDLGLMYGDTEWLSSVEFLKAGDHAVACAKVTYNPAAPLHHLL